MKKIALFSMVSASILGLVKIFSVVPFNRMADDDFAYANAVINSGFWHAQWNWYSTWTGKFASTFLQSLAQLTVGNNAKVIFLPVITIILLFVALNIFFSRFLTLKFINPYSPVVSTLLLVALYLITPNKAESWYWLTGSVIYLWPLVFLLVGISSIFLSKTRKIDYLISFLSIFIASAGNEEIGLLINVALFSALAFSFIYKRPVKLLITLLTASVISYAIVFFAPGNVIRGASGGSDQMNWVGSFIYSIQTGPVYLFDLISKHVFFLIPLVLVISYFFSALNRNLSKDSFEELLNKIFVSLIVPIGLSIFYLFPAYRALGRTPPDRSDISLAFVILMAIIAVSFYLGKIYNMIKLEKSPFFTIFVTSSSFLLIIFSFVFTSTIATDIYIAKNYSDAYDNMILQLRSAPKEESKEFIEIQKLPESGLIPPLQLKYEWIREAVSDFYKVPGITYINNKNVQ